MAGEQPLTDSFLGVLEWALTWWLEGREPGLAMVRDNVTALAPVTRWVAFAVLALALTGTAAAIAVRRRGDDLADGLVGAGRFLLVVSAGWLVLAAALRASDAVAAWVLGPRAAPAEYVRRVEEALQSADPTMARTLAVVGIATVLGFVAIVVARAIIAVVVAAGLPVVAAASLRRSPHALRWAAAWLVAVVVYRPLAAVVYRVSHDLVTSSQDPVVVLVVVVLTFLLCAALLPGVARMAATGRPA